MLSTSRVSALPPLSCQLTGFAGQILCRQNVTRQGVTSRVSATKNDWQAVDNSGLVWDKVAVSKAGMVAMSPLGSVGIASTGQPAVTYPSVGELKLDPSSLDAWQSASALAIPNGFYRFGSEETGTVVAERNGGLVAQSQGALFDDLTLHTVPSEQQLQVRNSHIILDGSQVAIIPTDEPGLVSLQDVSTSSLYRVPPDETALPASFIRASSEDEAVGTRFRMSKSSSSSTQSFMCPVLPTQASQTSAVSYQRYDKRVCTPDEPLSTAVVFELHVASFSKCMEACTNLGAECGSIQWQMQDPLLVQPQPQCLGFKGFCGSTDGIPSSGTNSDQCVQVPVPANSNELPFEFDGQSIAGRRLCCPAGDWQLHPTEAGTCTLPVVAPVQVASGQCDFQCYLNRYPDLIAAFGSTNVGRAETHWTSNGQGEGRDCTCPVPPPPVAPECRLFGMNSTDWQSACPSVSQAPGPHRYTAESGTPVIGSQGMSNHPWSFVFGKLQTAQTDSADNNCVSNWGLIPPTQVNTAGGGMASVGSVNKSGVLLKVLAIGTSSGCARECQQLRTCHHWILDGSSCELRAQTESDEPSVPCTSPGSCIQGPRSCNYIHLPFMEPAAGSLHPVSMPPLLHAVALDLCDQQPWCIAISCTTLLACNLMTGTAGALQPITNSSLWMKRQSWSLSSSCGMFEPVSMQASPDWHTVKISKSGHDATTAYANQAHLKKLVRVISPHGHCLVSGDPLKVELCSGSSKLSTKTVTQGPAIEWTEVEGVLCSSPECELGRADGGDEYLCTYNSDDRCQWNSLSIAKTQCAQWPLCSSFSEEVGQLHEMLVVNMCARAGSDHLCALDCATVEP